MRTHRLLPVFRLPGQAAAAGLLISVTVLPSGCVAMDNHPPAVTPLPIGTSAEVFPEHRRPALAPVDPNKAVVEKHNAKIEAMEMQAFVDPKRLIGLGPDRVLKRLGAPARVESGPLSREWIYATSDCSFRLFFCPGMNNSMSFKVLKYGSRKDNGEPTDSSDVCVRRLLTARNSDADN